MDFIITEIKGECSKRFDINPDITFVIHVNDCQSFLLVNYVGSLRCISGTSLLSTFTLIAYYAGDMMASSEDKKTLKILCIHGYRQNAQSFRERTGAFRKIPIIKKNTELVFITAPNRVPSLPAEEGQEASVDQDDRGWWFSSKDNSYMAQDYTDCCNGYQESLDLVKKTFEEQGPFDGILSFSQGAAFASLLCGLREQNHDTFKFDFAILVAGYKSRQLQHSEVYSIPISIPTLHVFGDTDRIIQKEMSEDLLQYFVEPKVLQHEGGHFIPASAPQKKVYTEFLQDMLDRKGQKS